jgi:hypothetical protein
MNVWICQACTVHNIPQVTQCHVCGAPRPNLLSALSFHVRATAPDGSQTIIQVPLLVAAGNFQAIHVPNIAQLFDPNPEFHPREPPASREQLQSLDKKVADGNAKDACSICLQNMVVGEKIVITQCKHEFHEHCAKGWFDVTATCPICRKVLEEPPETSRWCCF